MSELFRDWRRAPCDDGILLSTDEGWIRIRPRLGGFVDPRSILAEHLPGRTLAGVERRSLVTAEGEIAFVVQASIGDGRLAVAGVAGQEPAFCVDGIGPLRYGELVTMLLRDLGGGAGYHRRRPFLYRPPEGWLGLRRFAVTHWLDRGYPRRPGRAAVFDARPMSGASSDRLDRFLFSRFADELSEPEPLGVEDLITDLGLEGRLRIVRGTTREGRAVRRLAGAATDGAFVYLASFEGSDDPSSMKLFTDLFASIQPLPRPLADGDSIWRN